jgi:hypothetical protein
MSIPNRPAIAAKSTAEAIGLTIASSDVAKRTTA